MQVFAVAAWPRLCRLVLGQGLWLLQRFFAPPCWRSSAHSSLGEQVLVDGFVVVARPCFDLVVEKVTLLAFAKRQEEGLLLVGPSRSGQPQSAQVHGPTSSVLQGLEVKAQLLGVLVLETFEDLPHIEHLPFAAETIVQILQGVQLQARSQASSTFSSASIRDCGSHRGFAGVRQALPQDAELGPQEPVSFQRADVEVIALPSQLGPAFVCRGEPPDWCLTSTPQHHLPALAPHSAFLLSHMSQLSPVTLPWILLLLPYTVLPLRPSSTVTKYKAGDGVGQTRFMQRTAVQVPGGQRPVERQHVVMWNHQRLLVMRLPLAQFHGLVAGSPLRHRSRVLLLLVHKRGCVWWRAPLRSCCCCCSRGNFPKVSPR
ncbi:hypothetical protein INR49_002391 [Caranx melampygus]|nr:hypothetical protein INR49_002391 [Caranx melampygus]